MYMEDEEFEKEYGEILLGGIKNSPLRLDYERKVRALSDLRDRLYRQGVPEEETARRLHSERRELGRQYKEAAPPLFREYIYYATAQKYGDPLGPDYMTLRKRKSAREIIESSSRPIDDLDNRLTASGFLEWYQEVKKGE